MMLVAILLVGIHLVPSLSQDVSPPRLERISEEKIDIVMSQGEVFTQEIDPYDHFRWSDGVNRSVALMLVLADGTTNVSMFESIIMESNTIYALPMSDNAGINRYNLLARSFNNISTIPLEVLVIPNRHQPNHKLVLEFEFNYLLFEAYLDVRLEVLRLISNLLGDHGDPSNITLDSYENTTADGVGRMVMRISNKTIGFNPCNDSQFARIFAMHDKLVSSGEGQPVGQPREEVASVMETYGLVNVTVELLGPCIAKYRSLTMKDAENGGGLSWLKTGVPIVIITVLVALSAVVSVVLYRRRKVRSAGGRRHLGKAANGRLANEPDKSKLASGVKSKHIPVIFADELDEFSTNQPSAVSPLIMKDEKPPAATLPAVFNSVYSSNIIRNSSSNTPLNGNASPFNNSIDDFRSREGSMSLRAYSVASSQLQYSPSQYRPPPPYKPPSKSIVPQ